MGESDGTYEAKPIRGDLFVDRLVGYTTFGLAFVVLGAAVFRLATVGHAATEAVRMALILVAMIGAILISRSTRSGFTSAAAMYGLRFLVGLAYIPQMPTDRYLSMQLFFDLAMIAYCIFRRRALSIER